MIDEGKRRWAISLNKDEVQELIICLVWKHWRDNCWSGLWYSWHCLTRLIYILSFSTQYLWITDNPQLGSLKFLTTAFQFTFYILVGYQWWLAIYRIPLKMNIWKLNNPLIKSNVIFYSPKMQQLKLKQFHKMNSSLFPQQLQPFSHRLEDSTLYPWQPIKRLYYLYPKPAPISWTNSVDSHVCFT